MEERRDGRRRRGTSRAERRNGSLIADILSDPEARALEFGRSSVLTLPLQTAVKTGTSNDYRDAWTVGFSHRYTVGVWMGNLDRRPMREVTGSIGPALVFRAVLAELHRNREGKPLRLSRDASSDRDLPRERRAYRRKSCPRAMEWFRPETEPEAFCPLHSGTRGGRQLPRARFEIGKPSPGLHLALDPRIPDELERFALELRGSSRRAPGSSGGSTTRPSPSRTEEDGRALWPLTRGRHVAKARVWESEAEAPTWTEAVSFRVK